MGLNAFRSNVDGLLQQHHGFARLLLRHAEIRHVAERVRGIRPQLQIAPEVLRRRYAMRIGRPVSNRSTVVQETGAKKTPGLIRGRGSILTHFAPIGVKNRRPIAANRAGRKTSPCSRTRTRDRNLGGTVTSSGLVKGLDNDEVVVADSETGGTESGHETGQAAGIVFTAINEVVFTRHCLTTGAGVIHRDHRIISAQRV